MLRALIGDRLPTQKIPMALWISHLLIAIASWLLYVDYTRIETLHAIEEQGD